jgi:hypothetical protein
MMPWMFAAVQKYLQNDRFFLSTRRACSLLFVCVGLLLVHLVYQGQPSPVHMETHSLRLSAKVVSRQERYAQPFRRALPADLSSGGVLKSFSRLAFIGRYRACVRHDQSQAVGQPVG